MIIAWDPEEAIRIHLDWWGQCRTCRHWNGERFARSPDDGRCTNQESPLYFEITWWEGHCPKWDSFDEDAAITALYRDEAGP